MLHDLKAKLEKDATAEKRAYDDFYQWCEKVTGEELHSIKLDKERKDKLIASIDKYFAEIEQSGEQISEEAKAIFEAIKEGKSAKDLREKQHADFMTAEKELSDSIDMLARAITVLEKEMKKGSASFVQAVSQKLPSVLEVLSRTTDAAAFLTEDQSKLLALLDDDDELAAPAGEAYSKTKTGDIVQVLTDMKDKAETQLQKVQKGELQARNVYNHLIAALKAQKEADEKEKARETLEKEEATEDKAGASGNLKQTVKLLDVHTEAYRQTKAQCVQNANDHEAAVASRAQEMKAVDEATKVLEEMSAGTASKVYDFFQESSLQQVHSHSTSDLANLQVVTLVSHMAKSHHSTLLAQLASQISAYVKYGADSGEDIFAKIKGLIRDLITKLENEAKKDATEKAYCDKELAATEAKVGDIEDQLQKLNTDIDRKTAKSTSAKEEVRELQDELAKLAKEQADLDKVRQEENSAFVESKKDLELGIQGIRKALQVLGDYYNGAGQAAGPAGDATVDEAPPALIEVTSSAFSLLQRASQPSPPDLTHYKSSGAGSSIISILEMAEGDFATTLAKENTEESDSQDEYDKATKENELQKATMDQQIKFKTREYKQLDKELSLLVDDRDAIMTENADVLEYSVKIKDRCLAEPKDFAERKERRDSIITGLKEALAILKNDAVLLQHGNLRGKQ